MREKLEEAGALGPGETVRTTSFAQKGVGISPEFTQIEVGDTREFIVRVDRKLDLPAGTAVKVTLSKAAEKADADAQLKGVAGRRANRQRLGAASGSGARPMAFSWA